MSTDDHIKDGEARNALVAEYVLGLLSSGEHERVGRLIENDQGLRAERDFWVSRFAALNEGRLSAARPIQGLSVEEIGLMMGGAHGMEVAHA